MARQAYGLAQPAVYLSSLAPGTGKTTTMRFFLDELLTGTYTDAGVVVCLSRLRDIADVIEAVGIPRDMLAVLTTDEKVNALGGAEVNSAQVLFTTQQMIESRTQKTGSFSACAEFHYRGKPRAVRVWDESLLIGEAITVNRSDAAAVWLAVITHPKLGPMLDAVVREIASLEDGSLYTLPDFAETVGLNEALAYAVNRDGSPSPSTASDMAALWFLSGRAVRVRHDGRAGNTLLTYRETLPPDLLPLLVLDASGGVRHTYSEMDEGRGNIQHLSQARKCYERLSVNVWSVGGGKGQFERGSSSAKIRTDAIARLIDTKPDEEWLIVHHKESSRVGDVASAIRGALTTDSGRVHFLTWGEHHGTNEFRSVPNVVLAGVLYYPPSAYEALGRLSRGLAPDAGDYSATARARIADGEVRHHVLQAANRGTMRQADGDQCHPCNLYVMAQLTGGAAKLLGEVFPQCHVQRWRVGLDVELSGKVREAFAFIKAQLDNGVELVKIGDVAKAVGVAAANFAKDVRRHNAFVDALAEIGVTEYGKGQRKTHFRRLTASDFGFTTG